METQNTDPQTFVKVNVVLENNRVEFQPTMINLTKVVNIVSKELITTIKVVPRMREVVLQGANGTSSDSFYDVISNDDDTLKILVQIMNGMTASATELQKYLSYWDKYKPIW
jgi:dynein heavy chain